MFRQSLWSRITVLVAGLVIIVITLVSPGLNTSARPQLQQTRTRTATATRTATRTRTTTRTTTATTTATTTDQTTPPEDTTVTTDTVTMTASTVITSTNTPDTTVTSTVAPPTMTSAPTQTAAPTALPLTVLPTPTDDFQAAQESTPSATPTLTSTNDLVCLPGSPIDVTGEGPPRTPFLLYFNQRAVGGGSIGRDGRFSTPLVVGAERPGRYEVIVRVRGTTQVLRQFMCLVPELAPTPLLGSTPTVP